MKRELLNVKRGCYFFGCCPGHDTFPTNCYQNRRSKRARRRDKKLEHRYTRHLLKRHVAQLDRATVF